MTFSKQPDPPGCGSGSTTLAELPVHRFEVEEKGFQVLYTVKNVHNITGLVKLFLRLESYNKVIQFDKPAKKCQIYIHERKTKKQG